jgi:hypothetical protein
MNFFTVENTGISVSLEDGEIVQVKVIGRFSPNEAEQWVKAANLIVKAFPGSYWRRVREIVDNNINFVYSDL